MNENQQNKDLQKLRQEIDVIDYKILNLLNERMGIISQVALLKQSSNKKFYIH
jgi:chorismate mutase